MTWSGVFSWPISQLALLTWISGKRLSTSPQNIHARCLFLKSQRTKLYILNIRLRDICLTSEVYSCDICKGKVVMNREVEAWPDMPLLAAYRQLNWVLTWGTGNREAKIRCVKWHYAPRLDSHNVCQSGWRVMKLVQFWKVESYQITYGRWWCLQGGHIMVQTPRVNRLWEEGWLLFGFMRGHNKKSFSS